MIKWIVGLKATTIAISMLVAFLGIVGLRWFREHDARIRAEDAAKATLAQDQLTIAHWRDMYNATSARVDTQRILTRQIITNTVPVIDTALVYIHDTILVRRALDSAQHVIAACTESENRCEQLQRIAAHTIDSLSHLTLKRDTDRVKIFLPMPAPRFSRGIQLGGGLCQSLVHLNEREACASITYGIHLRIF